MPLPALNRIKVARSKDEARAYYLALSDDEKEQVGKDMQSGMDPIHAVNLARSRHLQDVARADVDEPEATTGEALAIGAGNAATMGGLPTMAAALGHGEGGTFAERKASNVADLERVRETAPMASASGELAGLVLPGAAGGVGRAVAPRLGLKLAAPTVARAGLLGGAPLGAMGGALSTDTGDAGDIAMRAGGGAILGGVLGAGAQAAPGVALRLAPALATPVSEAARAPLLTLEDIGVQGMANTAQGARDVAAAGLQGAADVLPSRIAVPGTRGLVGADAGGVKAGLSSLADRARGSFAQPGAGALRFSPTEADFGVPLGDSLPGGTPLDPNAPTAGPTYGGGPTELDSRALRLMPGRPLQNGGGLTMQEGPTELGGAPLPDVEHVSPTQNSAIPTVSGPAPASKDVVSAEELRRGVSPTIKPGLLQGEDQNIRPGMRVTPEMRARLGLEGPEAQAAADEAAARARPWLTPEDLPPSSSESAVSVVDRPRGRRTPPPAEPLEPTPVAGEWYPGGQTATSSNQNMGRLRLAASRSGASPFSDIIDESHLPTFDEFGNELRNPGITEAWRRAGVRLPSPAEGGPSSTRGMLDEDIAAHAQRGNPTKGGILGTSQYGPKRNALLAEQAAGDDLLARSAQDILATSRTASPRPGMPEAVQALREGYAAMPDEQFRALAARAGFTEAEVTAGLQRGAPRQPLKLAPPADEPAFLTESEPFDPREDVRSLTWHEREGGAEVIPETQTKAEQAARAARVKGDALPSDKGLQELLEANGIHDADFANRDAFGPEVREADLLAAWKRATKGARTWRDVVKHLPELQEAIGRDKPLSLPEHVRQRHLAVDVKGREMTPRMAASEFPVDENIEMGMAQERARGANLPPKPAARKPSGPTALERWRRQGLAGVSADLPPIPYSSGASDEYAARAARADFLNRAARQGDIAFDEALEAVRAAGGEPQEMIGRLTGMDPDAYHGAMRTYARLFRAPDNEAAEDLLAALPDDEVVQAARGRGIAETDPERARAALLDEWHTAHEEAGDF